MNKQELKQKFDSLYQTMTNSKKVSDMKLFGSILCELMYRLIDDHQELAEPLLDRLCSIRWHNYLTMDEAQAILDRMSPAPKWQYDQWSNDMEAMGATVENEPYYNEYALWVAMNMVYSDSANTIASIMGGSVNNIPEPQLLRAVYMLALDKLCDADKVFNIRHYFSI